MKSPTGIRTRAFVWIRPFQFFFAFGNFVLGLTEGGRWALIFAFFLPIVVIAGIVLYDTSRNYRKRYALGAGRTSTLRWIADLTLTAFTACSIAVALVTQYYAVDTVKQRFGPYNFQYMFTLMYCVFAFIEIALFFSTFVMLCVEDARMRKRGPTLLPFAAGSMPAAEQSLHRGTPESKPSSSFTRSERVSSPVSNHLTKEFTQEQLEAMSIVSATTKLDEKASPPSYRP